MKFARPLVLCILFLYSFPTFSIAEGISEITFRHNQGFGFKYERALFSNPNGIGEMLFSPGGGTGFEMGYSFSPNSIVEIYGNYNFQQHWALQFHASNFGSSRTSFSYRRSTIYTGANLRLKFSKASRLGIVLGGGPSLNLSGWLRVIELNADYGRGSFKPAVGFHGESGLFYTIGKWTFLPTARIRYLSLKSGKYLHPGEDSGSTEEEIATYQEYLSKVNASGIDFSFSIKFRLGKGIEKE